MGSIFTCNFGKVFHFSPMLCTMLFGSIGKHLYNYMKTRWPKYTIPAGSMSILTGFHTGFLGGGVEEVCGALPQCVWACVSTQHTHVNVCASQGGVWGIPPLGKTFLDFLRLLLMQSVTKFPAIILMTHT